MLSFENTGFRHCWVHRRYPSELRTSYPCIDNTFAMPHGHKISADVQWIVVRLSSLLEPLDFSTYKGVSLRSVERILQYFNTHGTVQVSEQDCRKAELRGLDVEVSSPLLLISQ